MHSRSAHRSLLVVGSVALDDIDGPFGLHKDLLGGSASFITWTDRAANKAYYARESTEFIEFAVKVLRSNRVIEKVPSAKEMVDLRFQ